MTTRRQIAIAALISALWALWLAQGFAGADSVDLSALYVAGFAVAEKVPEAIYAMHPDFLGPGTPEPLQALKAQIGAADHPTVPFVYPPLWAWAMAPLTKALPLTGFWDLMRWVHAAMIAAAPLLAWRLIRPPLGPLPFTVLTIVALTASAPGYLAMIHNQPQITVIFLVLLSFERLRAGASATSGALLALATALKLSPLFFVLIFALRRDLRALTGFALAGGALGLASVALAGWPLHREFLAVLGRIDALTILEKVNYAPETLLYQLSQLATGTPMADWSMTQATTTPEPRWIALTIKVALIAALAATWAATRRLPAETALPVQLLALSLATALFGPLSWAHYFLLPMILAPTLFLLMPAPRAWALVGALALLQSFPAYLIFFRASQSFYVTALAGAGGFLALLVVTLLAARKTSQIGA